MVKPRRLCLKLCLLGWSRLAAGQLINGQFFSPGLFILNSPEPGSTINAGQSTQLSIDTSADGLLPPPDPSLATTFLSLNIFLVSAQNGINVSVSNGGLLDQEKGSTVKHLNYEVPACLPPGAYNLTFYELSRINSSPFFTIDTIPLTVARSSSLSTSSSQSCTGSTTPQAQPQRDSRPPVQPLLGDGKSAFALSTGVVNLAVSATSTPTATTTTTATSVGNGNGGSPVNVGTKTSAVAEATISLISSAITPLATVTTVRESSTSTSSSISNLGGSYVSLPVQSNTKTTSLPSKLGSVSQVGTETLTTITEITTISRMVTIITTGAFPSIITASLPISRETTLTLVFPTNSKGVGVGPTSTLGVEPTGFGVFGVPVVGGAGGRGGMVQAGLGVGGAVLGAWLVLGFIERRY